LRAPVRRWPPFRLLWPGLAWTAAASLGIALGTLSPLGDVSDDVSVDAAAQVQTTETDEVLALAAGSLGDLSLEELP
jgi:hypothetical protein